MTFLDLFAGIGGFRRGMELAGHKCVGFCEFDKYAVASYTSMHLLTQEQRDYIQSIQAPLKKNGGLNLKQRQKEILKEEYRNGEWYADDIRRVDAASIPPADCWCFGAPCQDFSVAGKRAGLKGDRSSLIREVFRILEEIKEESRPEWIIYENVKGMLSSNHGFDYLEILLKLDKLGYDCEWQIFNSKDWGVPQNRERVYTIGHLRKCGERKILPITGTDGENCIRKLGNFMPTENRTNPNQGRIYRTDGLAHCLNKMDGGGREPHIAVVCNTNFTLTGQDRHGVGVNIPQLIGGVGEKNFGTQFRQGNRVYSADAISMRLTARSIGNTGGESYLYGIKVKEATKQGYAEAYEGDSINLSAPGSKTRRGRVGKDIANTLDTSCNQGIFVQVSEEFAVYAIWYEKYQCYIAIRKLTPLECFRLQGWEDEYFYRAALVNSDSQLYKQAGNGVTVNVVEAIAEKLN